MKPCHIICLSLVLSIFINCVTISPRHPEFTPKNILDIKVGMTQKEIEAIFGSPDRTSVMTMGTKTPDPWPSLIYYYDMRKNRVEKDKYIVYTNVITSYSIHYTKLYDQQHRAGHCFTFSASLYFRIRSHPGCRKCAHRRRTRRRRSSGPGCVGQIRSIALFQNHSFDIHGRSNGMAEPKAC